jgi:hypothetical protein
MQKILAASLALALVALPTFASATEVRVDTHRRAVIVAGDNVAVIARPHSKVVIVDGPNDKCEMRTVRVWVDGHYVMRRVTHCAN